MVHPTRRGFLQFLLTTALAESVDVEKLLWTPSPIVTVPEQQFIDIGQWIASGHFAIDKDPEHYMAGLKLGTFKIDLEFGPDDPWIPSLRRRV